MANFAYIIKDAKGARLEGIIKAGGLDEAVEKLTKEGATIISVKSAAESAFAGKDTLFDRLMLEFYKWRTGVSLKQIVFFTRQMATMFSAGLTIEKSLGDLEKEEKNVKFKRVLKKMNDDIRKGFSLSEAMEQHPGVFNALYVSLVKAGEVSGTLHTVLTDLADYLERIEDMKRKVNSAMVYPIFILCFLAVIIGVMFYWLIPKFAEVYSRYDADLPAPTLVAIAVSDWVRTHWVITISLILAFIVSLYLIYLTDRGRFIMDTINLRLPVVGSMKLNSVMSKFARTFSILMGAGVPIMEVMKLSQNVVQNAVISDAIVRSQVMVKEGYSVSGAFKKTGVFPSTLLQLASTGEETGDMDSLLMKAAEFYEKLVDSVIERLTSLIEPVLIIIMAVVVGGIIIVIYLPVFNLGLAMSSGMK